MSVFRIFAASAALSLACLYSGAAVATVLEGEVIGSSGAPKPFVRVLIRGPESRTAFTDEHGRFAVDLPPGTYVVEIVERNNRARKSGINVPAQGQIGETLQVDW